MNPDLIPGLRGVSHAWAFWCALIAGTVLTLYAPSGVARASAIVYGAGLCALFAASGLYHRWRWNPRWRPLLRRIDHSTIYIFIAASYTPVALLVLSGTIQVVVLASIWGGALAGVAMSVAWITAPRVLVAAQLRRAGLGRDRLAAADGRPARRRSDRAVRRGRRDLLGRRRGLAFSPPEPVAEHVRLPRDLPRARDPRRRHALRGDRGLGDPRQAHRAAYRHPALTGHHRCNTALGSGYSMA